MILAGVCVARFVLRFFLNWAGFKTQSALAKAIKNGVFVVQLINTAGMLVYLHADLLHSRDKPFMTYRDFTSGWYENVAPYIVAAVFLTAFVPLFELCGFKIIRTVFKVIDRRSIVPWPFQTAKTTIKQYIDLYGGPEYLIDYRYS